MWPPGGGSNEQEVLNDTQHHITQLRSIWTELWIENPFSKEITYWTYSTHLYYKSTQQSWPYLIKLPACCCEPVANPPDSHTNRCRGPKSCSLTQLISQAPPCGRYHPDTARVKQHIITQLAWPPSQAPGPVSLQTFSPTVTLHATHETMMCASCNKL